MEKKRMSKTKLLVILVPAMVLLLGVIIAVTSIMNYYSIVMNAVFGGSDIIIEKAEGSEDWDADYYKKESGSKASSDEAAGKLAVQAQEEGTVLLKNIGGALPLSSVTASSRMTVNAFGWSFYYAVNGGAGAGAIGSENLVFPEEVLSEAGIDINQGLKSAYLDWTNANYSSWGASSASRPTISVGMLAHWDIPELAGATLEDAVTTSNAPSNNTSVVWLGRSGGECADAPRNMDERGNVSIYKNADKHYLELSDQEEEVIAKAKQYKGSAGKVIVILNSPAPMEMAKLEDDADIDAILWVGAPGKQGYHALGKILVGSVNPSGRLPDTYAADFLKDPTMENFSDPNIYSKDHNSGELMAFYDKTITYAGNKTRNIFYVGYEEGIYMGYRWYETAAAEGYFASGSLPAGVTDKFYNRENGVVYPFGFGLSYTTFSQKITSSSYSAGTFNFNIEVENIGAKAGKDVVQLYAETPYTKGGVEKAKVVLAAFDKTDVLAAGGKATVELSVKAEDIASYDDKVNKCYVLDAGTYNFYLGTAGSVNYGSHSWAYADDDSKASFANAITSRIVFGENNPRESEKFAHNDIGVNYRAATNIFEQEMVGNNLKTKDGGKSMSRNNFTGSYPTSPTAEDRIMSDGLKAILEGNLFDDEEQTKKHNNPDDVMPEIGKDNGLKLIDLRGLDYDDPAWDRYVEQFNLDELIVFAGRSGWETAEVTRLGKPRTNDNDGPQCLKFQALGTDAVAQYLCAFPCEVVLAATWNTDLLKEIGRAIGEEGLQYGVNGWYAPGLNIHRTPFSGRNFEYFSEDPVLSGKLCAAEVSGAADKGLYAYVKHFVLNDQESYARSYNSGKCIEDLRNITDCVLLTWATEQTMREVYFKAFEIVFKEATTDITYLDGNGNVKVREDFRAATAVMTSFNFIGNTWAGGDYNLITNVLRNEWGFKGLVLTDSVRTPYMYADQMLRAGGDACLMSYQIPIHDTKSATAVKNMVDTAKNLCYTVVHSNAMSDIPPGSIISYTLAPWQVGLLIAWVIVSLAVMAGLGFIVYRIIDERNNPEKYGKRRAV